MEWLAPLGLFPRGLSVSAAIAGGSVLAAGLMMEWLAARALSSSGTTTRPFGEPEALVTNGPFRYSRNPFYIGLLLLLSGVCIWFSLDWAVLFIPLLWLALHLFVVPGEERLLQARFGDAFTSYKSSTRRWL